MKSNTLMKAISANWSNIVMIILIGMLILLSAAVRLLTFDRYWPFVDYTDEAVYVGHGLHQRGISDEMPLIERYGIMPPAYLWVNIGTQTIYDALKTHPYQITAEYFYVLRLLAAVTGVLTTIVIASIAWQIADWRAALLAGVIWGLAPLIVEYNNLAIPDPFVYLFSALALSSAIAAWKRESPLWLLLSLLSGITVIYLKFWIVITLVPFFVVLCILLLRKRQKFLPWTLLYAGLAVASAAYIILVVDPLNNAIGMSQTSSISLLTRAIDSARLLNNWQMAIIPLGGKLFWTFILGGTLAGLYSRYRQWRTVHVGAVFLLILYIMLGMLLTAAISNVTPDGRMRHLYPTALALYALWGGAVVQLLWTVDALLSKHKSTFLSYVPSIIWLLVVANLVMGYLRADWQLVRTYRRDHVVNALRNWTDDNVPVDGLVMFVAGQSDLDRVWNRLWGAYAGDRPFVWWMEPAESIVQTPPEEFVARNIQYLMVNQEDLRRQSAETRTALEAYFANLTLIKTFDVQMLGLAGSTTYFYQLSPLETIVDFDFGSEIRLVGYDMPQQPTVRAGETLVFRPYWRALQVPQTNYSMFMHLHTESDTTPIAQYDGPLTVVERPTMTWWDLNELYIGQDIPFMLPADLAPGDYVLTIGVYDYQTGQRLLSETGTSFSMDLTVAP